MRRICVHTDFSGYQNGNTQWFRTVGYSTMIYVTHSDLRNATRIDFSGYSTVVRVTHSDLRNTTHIDF